MSQKIKSLTELEKAIQELKSKGKKIIATNGCFDILHTAHLHVLESSKALGDVLIVLINSDASVKSYKGDARPIIPEQERAEMLSALACVDYVAIFQEATPLAALKIIKPDILAKGGAFLPERIKAEKELLASWGGKLVTFPLENGYSTTSIINKILETYKK